MAKIITIEVNYPATIYAFDNDGQWMRVTRPESADHPSDGDICVVTSQRPNEAELTGTITWGKAFAGIADFMNATELDNGWNT